jgi:hypothetical protein
MAEPRVPDPILLVVAVISRHTAVHDWAREHLEPLFGPVALTSPFFAFNQTAYYQPTMGPDLRQRFLAFQRLVEADCLASVKLQTNELERLCADSGSYPEPRPLNLDPGVLSLGKFLLATVKDQAHRIYLGRGIFAEVTLRYQAGAWEPWPWTYPSYRLPDLLAFLQEARDFYRQRLLGP